MRLHELRVQKKLTQDELSTLSGVSQSKISEYEKGKIMPGLTAVIKLARALNVTIDELVSSNQKAV